jgi:hypothetical protein
MLNKVYFKLNILPVINGSADLMQLYFWNNWYSYANYEWNGFHDKYRTAAHKMELKNKAKRFLERRRTKIILKYLPLDSDTSSIVISFI